ncbi:hypothetical protein BCV71DRAFT_281404 [Rhizopus microsporus]|uniref:Uncharacterized protein n=1 Tax=Rhizopus microsporus TaxID=58291 RepID=A0A1X0S7E8_RHIZD|nr:hypothetical protein BCV71DRAFT_281404 [Rhizopus microsporus]
MATSTLPKTTFPPDSELPPPAKAARPTATKPLPSQAATAYAFIPPSSNQDFKYLYVPVLCSDYDACSHALDIHYPGRHLIALLIHNDYESEFRSQLNCSCRLRWV